MKSNKKGVLGLAAVLALAFGATSGVAAFATVDAITTVHLVIDDYNAEKYLVKPMPFSGCYGIEHGPQAATFAEPFRIKVQRGCGGVATEEDINALTCADAEYDYGADYDKVHAVTIDLANCQIAPNRMASFTRAVRKAAKLNFGSSVRLTIK